ncbi:MAG: zinc ABC transporter substrate-binding protein [Candidatus Auribacterota bacterium]|jgi:zinc transport system substrate-binding protein|nr:zinc ABC transporter substrate-binding protein [Candidatus Auribacterota bacterium]
MKTHVIALLILTMLKTHVNAQSADASNIHAYVSIDPVGYIAEQVAGEHIKIHVLMPKNQNPHTFEPTPKQLQMLSQAQLYFKIGLQFEEHILKNFQQNFQNLRIVDCSHGIVKRHMENHKGDHHECSEHNHSDANDKETHPPDPHIWLSPPNIVIMANNIRDAFIQIDPANEQAYSNNCENFIKRVTEVHSRLIEVLKPFKDSRFFVYHPAFGYFTDTYGIEQFAIETGGKSPTPKQLAHLIQQAKTENVKVIFVQPQFDKRNAQSIASAINGSVVVLNPLEKNLIDNLMHIADSIEKSFKQ